MPRVLVVDDQSNVRAMIAIVLRVNRFEIVEAASAATALQAFADSSFDTLWGDAESLLIQLHRRCNGQCHIAQLVPPYQRSLHQNLLSHNLQRIPIDVLLYALRGFLGVLCG